MDVYIVHDCLRCGVRLFNISGSLFVNEATDESIRSSAQGLFMLMTNGFGNTIGTLGAQFVVNKLVYSQSDIASQISGWSSAWYILPVMP